MFKCDYCGSSVGPWIKPIKVIHSTRPTIYTSMNEEGEIITTKGSEIVQEFNQGPCCSPSIMGPVFPVPIDFSTYKVIANTSHGHARGCKKLLGDCKVCDKLIEGFKSFPLPGLSKALEQPLHATLKVSMASMLIEQALLMANDRSKMSQASVMLNYGTLKAYETRGGGL